jgi:hypothetical protein
MAYWVANASAHMHSKQYRLRLSHGGHMPGYLQVAADMQDGQMYHSSDVHIRVASSGLQAPHQQPLLLLLCLPTSMQFKSRGGPSPVLIKVINNGRTAGTTCSVRAPLTITAAGSTLLTAATGAARWPVRKFSSRQPERSRSSSQLAWLARKWVTRRRRRRTCRAPPATCRCRGRTTVAVGNAARRSATLTRSAPGSCSGTARVTTVAVLAMGKIAAG